MALVAHPRRRLLAAAATFLCLSAPGTLLAQTPPLPPEAAPPPAPPVSAIVTLRGGVQVGPKFFGSDDYDFSGEGALRFDYLRLPGGLEFGRVGGAGELEGFGLRGSVRYIGTRQPWDAPYLEGTDTVDSSLELGFGVGYDAEFWRAFGVARYGVTGHESFVGTFGADALLRPTPDWLLNFGPRADWGGSGFMREYFGVTAEEASRSVLDEYQASSGFYSVGVEFGARYAFSPAWGVEGAVTYDRLIGDAADSPITEFGTRDQFGARIGITRSISLGF